MSKNKPDKQYYQDLKNMIKKIKKETGWKDILKITEEAQIRLNRKEKKDDGQKTSLRGLLTIV